TLTIPLEGTPSESEIRIAQAQLVGWLEGLFQGIQAALWRSTCRRGLSSTRCAVEDCHLVPLSNSPATASRVSISRAHSGPIAADDGSDHVRRGPAGVAPYSSVDDSSASIAETRLKLTARRPDASVSRISPSSVSSISVPMI